MNTCSQAIPTRRRTGVRIWLRQNYFLAIPFLLYGFTAHRTLGLPDAAVVIEVMTAPVLSACATNHSLNNVLGWMFLRLFAFVPRVVAANLLSAVYGGVVIGLFYFILLESGAPRRKAMACAAVFMVSHSMWWHATITENYALSLLLALASLLLILRENRAWRRGNTSLRRWAGIFFIAGLSMANHLQNAALCLAAGAALLSQSERIRRRPVRTLVTAITAGGMGGLFFIIMAVRDLGAGHSIAWILGGGFTRIMFHYDWVDAGRRLGDWLVLQFPSPFLIAIAAGIPFSLHAARQPKGDRPFWVYVWTWMLVTLIFVGGYTTWDQFSFYLPVFAGLAIMASMGICRWRPSNHTLRVLQTLMLGLSIITPPFVYIHIRHWAHDPTGFWGRRYAAISEAYRTRYDLVGLLTDPMTHDRGTLEAFIRTVMTTLPTNAIWVDDMSTYYQIEFIRKNEGLRPDIRVEAVVPPMLQEHGWTPSELADELVRSTARIFLVTPNGLPGTLAIILCERGWTPSVFSINGRYTLTELTPPRA